MTGGFDYSPPCRALRQPRWGLSVTRQPPEPLSSIVRLRCTCAAGHCRTRRGADRVTRRLTVLSHLGALDASRSICLPWRSSPWALRNSCSPACCRTSPPRSAFRSDGGVLTSAFAIGMVVGAPLMAALTRRWPPERPAGLRARCSARRLAGGQPSLRYALLCVPAAIGVVKGIPARAGKPPRTLRLARLCGTRSPNSRCPG